MMRRILAAFVVFSAGADWAQFRGPESCAVASDAVTSQLAKDVAWKVDLPGRGLSSPIIVGDKLFLTASSGAKQNQLHVLAFDTSSGKKLWERSFWATGPTASHPKSCMAAPTPVSDGRYVIALFATNDLVGLDLDGSVRWVRSLFEEFPGASDGRGLAASPVIVAGTLIVPCDNQNNSFALGIDMATGKNRWKLARPKSTAWTTPIPLPGAEPGAALILFQGGTDLTAYEPATGKEVWKLSRSLHPIASTARSGNMLYVPGEKGLCAFEMQGTRAEPKLLWEKPKLNPDMASPVVVDGRVLVLHQGMLVSGDGKTGEVTGQLRLKGAFSSSPVAAGGRIYCFSETGIGQVIEPGDKDARLVDSAELKEPILCTPAIANGALYVRSDKHLWKIAKKG